LCRLILQTTKFIVVLKLSYFTHRWHSGRTDLQENNARGLCNKNLSMPSEARINLTQVFVIFLSGNDHCCGSSQYRLATDWMVRGSNPGGGEIFRTRPDQPWCPPSLLYNGYWVFPGVRAAGAWRWSTNLHQEPKLRKE
jgi:hypothetical protein